MTVVKRKVRKGTRVWFQVADGVEEYRVTADARRFDNNVMVYRCMPAATSPDWGELPPRYVSEAELERMVQAERRRRAN